MSTQFTNRQWRLPNNENKSKQSNYSMDFDGSSYIDAGSAYYLNSLSEFSISVWFNLTTAASNKCIVSDWKYNTSPLGHFTLQTADASNINYAVLLFIKTTSDVGVNHVKTSAILTQNNWHHAVFTYNSGTVNCYIDGSSVSLTTSGTIPSNLTNQDGNLLIGDFAGLSRFWLGQIDAVSIFNYELSASQVTTLYGSSSTGIGNPMSLSPAPVAYYPLGDQDAFNGADYLVPNSSLKDYVFSFDADYIDTFEIPATYTALTLSCWVNFDNLTAYSTVLGQWVNNSFANSTVLMYLDNTGKIQVLYSTGSSYTRAGLNTTLSTNTWYNLVTTWDGTTVKLYVNSFLQTTTGSLSSLNDANVTLKLGAYNSGASTINHLDGKLSNAQIFNSALSATGSNSVETLYNNGSPLTSISGFTSLQGWWKLDASATYDGTNWSIPDDSSNSNDGTSSGMTQSALQQSDLSFKTSISPYALSFSGSGDYIDLNSDITLTGNKSVSFWVNFTSTIAGVVFGGASSNYYPYIDATSIYIRAGGALSTFAHGGLTAGVWYNICITGDGTNATAYLNGSSLGTQTDKGFTFKLINAEGAGYYGVDGKLSNCAIWNAALTSSQVKEIYNEGVPSNLNNHSAYSNLVSWWQLGSNSSFNTNWTVLDEKGSNNGTSVNMIESDIVDGVNSYANGLSSGMGGDEVIGDAPYSSSNSLSVNMDVEDRTTDTPS